jgi:acetylornithine aminotransferase/acetylornithine/N-succinyldiaminopimelate aminotransferase
VRVPYGDVAALTEALSDARGPKIAAVFVEPIPSMGGIRVASTEWFGELRRLCDEHGILLVFDEVQTGFGRTGTLFFGEQVGVVPDLITTAKGIAGGMPAGAVFVRESVAETIGNGEQGTTFGGGPLAAAAMAAVADVLVEEDLAAHAGRVGAALAERLAAVPGVESVAGRGLLIGINLDRAAKPVVGALRERGILVGGSGVPQQIRLLPPLTLTLEQTQPFVEALEEILASTASEAVAT